MGRQLPRRAVTEWMVRGALQRNYISVATLGLLNQNLGSNCVDIKKKKKGEEEQYYLVFASRKGRVWDEMGFLRVAGRMLFITCISSRTFEIVVVAEAWTGKSAGPVQIMGTSHWKANKYIVSRAISSLVTCFTEPKG